MAAVDIGVAEDDDAAVAASSRLKSGPEPAPMAVNSAWASALSITCLRVDLPALTTLPGGEVPPVLGVAPRLGRTGRGVALDDEQLGTRRRGAAVGELVGHGR